MKRTLRRIASLLCALSLCLTLLPGMARAEDTPPLPEEPAAIECICQILCTEDAVNPECPLCSLEGADLTLCLGCCTRDFRRGAHRARGSCRRTCG